MDLALLAVSALGFLGIFLMLPRERPGLARIGALVGVLALAGFFLYLARQMPAGATTPPIAFYLFAGIMIFGAVSVICHPKPVYAVLYFVLVTLAGAGLFVLLAAEFMAIVLIIVYAGAILVTYVFVIMLASQGGPEKAAEYDRVAAEPLIPVFVSFLLLGTILQVMLPKTDAAQAARSNLNHTDALMLAHLGAPPAQPATTKPVSTTSVTETIGLHIEIASDTTTLSTQNSALSTTSSPPPRPSNIQVLGAALYTRYAISLELAGVLLTIALVGSVVIARKNSPGEEAGAPVVPQE